MFGKLLNSYYYGKSGKGDYNKADLPQNRWQLFLEMLRIRFSALFRLNLMTVLVFVPTMYVIAQLVGNVYSLMSIAYQVEQDIAAASPEYLEIYRNQAQGLYNLVFMTLLKLIPCIAITGPFQAGMAYITRNWARDEHAFIWSDFKDALKANWKQSLLVSSITGLVPFMVLVCWKFYGGMAQQNVIFIIPQVLTLTLGLIWMLAVAFLYPMLVTYEMKTGLLLKNGFLLAIGRLPQIAGARLAMLLPTGIALLVGFYTPYGLYAMMALGGYYLLLGNALARFVFASYTNGVFDKYINNRLEGVAVNRGLATPEDLGDDDEEDEETPEAQGKN